MKHAFLIMAHDNLPLLRRIVMRLDHPNSNVYVHIDKKTEIPNDFEEELKAAVRFASVMCVPRLQVTWGGYSQIQCELNLLRIALRDHNDYYHLISGHDYPLVSMDYFDEFFSVNIGKEFIGFSKPGFAKEESQRYCVNYYFQDFAGRNRKSIFWWINKMLVKLQVLIGIDKTKRYQNVLFEAGSQWVSISHSFAEYLLNNENQIRKLFRYGYCCDELFVQTMFVNSNGKFENYLGIHSQIENQQNMRVIDWTRGNPYVFTGEDYGELVASGMLFCRKVDTDTDKHRRLLDALDMV